jgi:predicted nucleic acid-binding protein
MGQKYLIDTNTIIDFLSKNLPEEFLSKYFNEIINQKPNISIITKIELLGFNASKESEILLNEFVNDCNIIELSNQISIETIKLRRNYKIKVPDAIIAASSIVNNFTLITRNVNDFKKIETLKLLNPYDV